MMKKFFVSLFLFSVLLANTVLAQNNVLDIVSSLLTQYIGVVFIIIFVFILLLIGGVIKWPRFGGGIMPMIVFFILIVSVFVLPQFIKFPDYVKNVPPDFKIYQLPPGSDTALQLMGLPAEWAWIPAIIYLFILPFAGIYTLVWAFLTTLAIFPQTNINRILALIITFLTIPTGWFIQVVWALFSFMGLASVLVFAATFIAGIFFHGAGIAAKQHMEFRKYVGTRAQTTNSIKKQLETLVREHADETTTQNAIGGILVAFPDYFTLATRPLMEQARAAAAEGHMDVAYGKISELVKKLK